jgi:predicted Zn-dependent protease
MSMGGYSSGGRGRGLSGRLVIAIVLVLVAVVSYYGKSSTNPFSGEKQYVSLTPAQEIALGLKAAPEMAQQFGGVSRDAAATNQVKQMGAELTSNKAIRATPYQFKFHLLADPKTINAFALPGVLRRR